MDGKLLELQETLRHYALTLPEAHQDEMLGHIVVKAQKKPFLFLSLSEIYEGKLGMSVKLPQSAKAAEALPYAERGAYALGQAGWMTMRLGPDEPADLDLWRGWIAESYRANAPKQLVKRLDEAGA